MYIVRDKITKQILHTNPAPLRQNLGSSEVYHAFNAATMEIGRIEGSLPEHWLIESDGSIRALTDAEKIAAGILVPGPDEKVVAGQIVPRTRQDRVDGSEITLQDVREAEVLRLRGEVEMYFRTAKTTNGYRLDNLARQKAAVSLQYRATDNADPEKSALLASGIIYADTVTDEILAKMQAIQEAYDQAKAAIDLCLSQNKTVAEFEAVALATYLS